MLSMLPCFGMVGPVQQKRIVLGKSDTMGNGEVTLNSAEYPCGKVRDSAAISMVRPVYHCQVQDYTLLV